MVNGTTTIERMLCQGLENIIDCRHLVPELPAEALVDALRACVHKISRNTTTCVFDYPVVNGQGESPRPCLHTINES
jgi:hypothetical protein